MFLLKVAVLIVLSSILVRSDQIIDSLKSFKLSENVTYDCVNIYKQPSLDHPLLKTHKIQMKPSVLRPESKNHVRNKAHKKKIRCPEGTVPILRNTKEYVSNVRRLEEMHFNPLTDNPGNTHMSGVKTTTSGGPYHGVEGYFSANELNIGKDQASYAFIYLGSKTNFIQAGWMINPGVFGDQNVWSYGFWRGKNVEGCYNVNCPGFVQVARDEPIGYRNPHFSGIGWFHLSIHQDEKTGNWWLSDVGVGRNLYIGYWPKELFDFMSDNAERVGAAGAVKASDYGSCPPMGTGTRPSDNINFSAMFEKVGFLDSKYQKRRIDHTGLIVTLNGGKCYEYRKGQYSLSAGFYFHYGGPGGKWC